MHSQNSLKTFHKQIYATPQPQIAHNQFAHSHGTCGKLVSSLFISYKVLIEPPKSFESFVQWPFSQ